MVQKKKNWLVNEFILEALKVPHIDTKFTDNFFEPVLEEGVHRIHNIDQV